MLQASLNPTTVSALYQQNLPAATANPDSGVESTSDGAFATFGSTGPGTDATIDNSTSP